MRTSVVIVVGGLLVGAVAVWKLQGPTLKSCRAQRAPSVEFPNDRYMARVEIELCDEGLRSGLFVLVEKPGEPGTLHEAFYSPRKLNTAALRWPKERELEISFSEPLDATEREYNGHPIGGDVTVKLKEAGENRGSRPLTPRWSGRVKR